MAHYITRTEKLWLFYLMKQCLVIIIALFIEQNGWK